MVTLGGNVSAMVSDAPKFLSQAAFAKRRGVSKKTVTVWKQRGLLKLTDAGDVDVDASEWNLDQRPPTYRGGVTHRPVRDAQVTRQQVTPKPKAEAPAKPRRAVQNLDIGESDDALPPYDPDSSELDLAEAVRRKENWLGLQRKQIVEKEAERLVDRAVAEALFFDTARDLRDAWLSWPARVAVVMADELNIDARALTTVLTAHVQQHLAELGEPECQL